MALPTVLLKAKNAVKKGAQAYNAGKQANAQKQSSLTTAMSFISPLIKIKIITAVVLAFTVFLMFIVILGFITKFELIQGIDSSFGRNHTSAGVLNLDSDTLENYYQASEGATESTNKPEADLSQTEYLTVDGFNQHIKSSVENAGYGTREGVVAAGVSLVGDYILATGKRLRYDQYRLGGRQGPDTEGITNQNFYLDCSSFAWWAVYNGGFKTPSYPQTLVQMGWARGINSLKSVDSGQPGDFLVSPAHIVLIIGIYEGGYYCAEFSSWGVGAKITKRNISSLSNSSYALIDMERYYNDATSIR